MSNTNIQTEEDHSGEEPMDESCDTHVTTVANSNCPKSVPTANQSLKQSSTGVWPCLDVYPGEYDFEVHLSEAVCNNKGSWMYSSKLGKVFVDINKILLFQFKLNTKILQGLRVRALLVYATSDHLKHPVDRCMLHAFKADSNFLAHMQDNVCQCNNSNRAGHVITSNHEKAEYEYNTESGRHSIVVPLDEPFVGSESTSIAYKFGCKTSCVGGMARRPIKLVFTLEKDQGEVIGRSVLLVKVCSCPKRDMEREEEFSPSNISDEEISDSTENNSTEPSRKESAQTCLPQLFNQIETMSELLRRSVEFQKTQIENAFKNQIEVMDALEELSSICSQFDSYFKKTAEE